MRYELTADGERAVKAFANEMSLNDEVALIRWTIQDLVRMLEMQQAPQRIAVGSMLRDAIETLSRVLERAARLPRSPDMVSREQVSAMLHNIEDLARRGLAGDQLIMSIKGLLEGISREEPGVKVLRTCEMMDRSVPYIEFQSDTREEPS